MISDADRNLSVRDLRFRCMVLVTVAFHRAVDLDEINSQ